MTPDELTAFKQIEEKHKELMRAAPRPARVEHLQVPMSESLPMYKFPAKYSHTLERNQKLKLCCRHMENVLGRLFKTNPDLKHADLFIATCQVCGCKHHRLAVGSGSVPR